MPQVIANYPEPRRSHVDGYIAVPLLTDCGRMGSRYVLRLDGVTISSRWQTAPRCGTWRTSNTRSAAAGLQTLTRRFGTTCPTYHKGAILWPERLQGAPAQKGEGTVSIEQDAISLAVKNSLYAYGMAYKRQHEVDKLGRWIPGRIHGNLS